MLYYIILCYIVPYYIIVYDIISYYIIVYYIIFCVLYNILLYYIIYIYCIILYMIWQWNAYTHWDAWRMSSKFYLRDSWEDRVKVHNNTKDQREVPAFLHLCIWR